MKSDAHLPPGAEDAVAQKAIQQVLTHVSDPIPRLVKRLDERARERLRTHFLALADDDRYLRFGAPMSDAALSRYVDGMNFRRDAIFGVYDDDLNLVGVAHLALAEEVSGAAELGLSVLPAARGAGLGTELFNRAATHARNEGVSTLFMHCLSENSAILHIARKARMKIHPQGPESDAFLTLPPADVASYWEEAAQEQSALFDMRLKQQMAALRGWFRMLAEAA